MNSNSSAMYAPQHDEENWDDYVHQPNQQQLPQQVQSQYPPPPPSPSSMSDQEGEENWDNYVYQPNQQQLPQQVQFQYPPPPPSPSSMSDQEENWDNYVYQPEASHTASQPQQTQSQYPPPPPPPLSSSSSTSDREEEENWDDIVYEPQQPLQQPQQEQHQQKQQALELFDPQKIHYILTYIFNTLIKPPPPPSPHIIKIKMNNNSGAITGFTDIINWGKPGFWASMMVPPLNSAMYLLGMKKKTGTTMFSTSSSSSPSNSSLSTCQWSANDGTTSAPTRASAKRKNYITWEDYFMATAFLAAKRSKDPNYQVGACIVTKDRKIVGTGYNGMPNGCHDDEFPWTKNKDDPIESKFTYVCHAELNAIVNKYFADIKGCTLYVGLFPCNECAKLIIQEGITEVVYAADKNWDRWDNAAARKMFDAAGVIYRKFAPGGKEIVIKFP